MLSYHNDESLKSKVVAEMKKHQEQDQFIKGTYGRRMGIDGKFLGCAVGCTIDSLNLALGKNYNIGSLGLDGLGQTKPPHEVIEEALGISEWLAHIQDVLFEDLPEKENSQFSVDFLEAIPVGVDLEPVKFKFGAFLLKENVAIIAKKSDISRLEEQALGYLNDALSLYECAIDTGVWDNGKALNLMSVAESLGEDAGEAGLYDAQSITDVVRGALLLFMVEIIECTTQYFYYDDTNLYKKCASELISILKDCK